MLKIKPWHIILDIECGSAKVLRELNSMGFYRLTGVDKFINTEINQFGLKVRALELKELSGKYDVIMMHHVLEHMPDRQSIFNLIKCYYQKWFYNSTPIKNEVYNLYGSNWAQLVAPRHFYLHTLNSLKFLIEKSDLHLQEVIYDSTGFQFWGSEQYKRDISLYRNLQSQLLSQGGLFTIEEMRQWDAKASEFNQKELGDQIMLIIRH